MSECILTLPPCSFRVNGEPTDEFLIHAELILWHQRVCPGVVGNPFLMNRVFVLQIAEKSSLVRVDSGLHLCRTRPISRGANPFALRVYVFLPPPRVCSASVRPLGKYAAPQRTVLRFRRGCAVYPEERVLRRGLLVRACPDVNREVGTVAPRSFPTPFTESGARCSLATVAYPPM